MSSAFADRPAYDAHRVLMRPCLHPAPRWAWSPSAIVAGGGRHGTPRRSPVGWSSSLGGVDLIPLVASCGLTGDGCGDARSQVQLESHCRMGSAGTDGCG